MFYAVGNSNRLEGGHYYQHQPQMWGKINHDRVTTFLPLGRHPFKETNKHVLEVIFCLYDSFWPGAISRMAQGQVMISDKMWHLLLSKNDKIFNDICRCKPLCQNKCYSFCSNSKWLLKISYALIVLHRGIYDRLAQVNHPLATYQ